MGVDTWTQHAIIWHVLGLHQADIVFKKNEYDASIFFREKKRIIICYSRN